MLNYMQEKLVRRIKGCFSWFKHLKKALHLLVLSLSDPYWLHVFYFVGVSIVGMLVLWLLPSKTKRDLNLMDAFYTSVSAATVSSLGVVPMQDLSEKQLVVLVILMFVGGEVFTSTLCLQLTRLRLHGSKKLHHSNTDSIEMLDPDIRRNYSTSDDLLQRRMDSDTNVNSNVYTNKANAMAICDSDNILEDDFLEYDAVKRLGYISLLYLVLVQLGGVIAVAIYFPFSSSGKQILQSRGILMPIFAVFTVVSSFANCGFTPLNENMYPFRKNHGLLLIILAFQILLGNTMFAPCFRALLWTLRHFTKDRRIYDYILSKHGLRLFPHLFSSRMCVWLIFTVVGFLTVELILLLALQWDSEALEGLSTLEKLISGVFQSVAIRHAGENVVNPQLLSSAVIVLYIIMMYLPPYPMYVADGEAGETKRRNSSSTGRHDESIAMQFEKLLLHDLCYLIIAVMLICITERHRLNQDPLNFKVDNIVFEVVSAYGNVGMSIGYSCSLFSEISKGQCEDVPYSLSGKWSVKGKIIIIMVMFLGRLKGIKHNSSVKIHWLAQYFDFTCKKDNKPSNQIARPML